MRDIIKKSILFGLGAVYLTAEEVEKFVKDLQKDSSLTPEEGKKLVKEVVDDIDKKFKNKDLGKKVRDLFRSKTPATKEDIEELRKEINKLK